MDVPTSFFPGNSVMIRDSVGRVLPQLPQSHRFHSYVKGMYAFGLEETNYFALAERYAFLKPGELNMSYKYSKFLRWSI